MARKKLKNLDTVDLDQAALLEALQNDLKKIDKNDEFSHVSDDIYDDSACGVTEWVSTGCSTLDLAVSNRPNGGLPVGKIVEFYGLEGSGKSAFSAYIIKNTYKMGGVSYYK
jgi:recombination protein RecA